MQGRRKKKEIERQTEILIDRKMDREMERVCVGWRGGGWRREKPTEMGIDIEKDPCTCNASTL